MIVNKVVNTRIEYSETIDGITFTAIDHGGGVKGISITKGMQKGAYIPYDSSKDLYSFLGKLHALDSEHD